MKKMKNDFRGEGTKNLISDGVIGIGSSEFQSFPIRLRKDFSFLIPKAIKDSLGLKKYDLVEVAIRQINVGYAQQMYPHIPYFVVEGVKPRIREIKCPVCSRFGSLAIRGKLDKKLRSLVVIHSKRDGYSGRVNHYISPIKYGEIYEIVAKKYHLNYTNASAYRQQQQYEYAERRKREDEILRHLFWSFKSIKDIAEEMKISKSTVYQRLIQLGELEALNKTKGKSKWASSSTCKSFQPVEKEGSEKFDALCVCGHPRYWHDRHGICEHAECKMLGWGKMAK